MKFIIFGTMRSLRNTRCQYYKGVHKERCGCICLSHFYAYMSKVASAIGHWAYVHTELHRNELFE